MSLLRQVGARQTLAKLALAVAVAAGIGATGSVLVQARDGATPGFDGEETVALSTLPPQAQQTQQRIRLGGPFPYDKDGDVFLNRERQLPPQPRGWYREYTVKTPGADDRGARRIVCGGDLPTAPQACYYTADHYTSFRRIVP